jgi:hypothetical protein
MKLFIEEKRILTVRPSLYLPSIHISPLLRGHSSTSSSRITGSALSLSEGRQQARMLEWENMPSATTNSYPQLS